MAQSIVLLSYSDPKHENKFAATCQWVFPPLE